MQSYNIFSKTARIIGFISFRTDVFARFLPNNAAGEPQHTVNIEVGRVCGPLDDRLVGLGDVSGLDTPLLGIEVVGTGTEVLDGAEGMAKETDFNETKGSIG